MFGRKILVVAYWIIMIVAPLIITAAVLLTLPEHVQQVPMQVGFDGEVNRWSSPSEFWLLGGIMAGCNLLLALCYRFYHALNAAGLVHGVSNPLAGRIILMVTAGILVAVTGWCYWALLGKR